MYSTPSNTPVFTNPRGAPVARFVGVPFQSGGRDRATGLDCWGLVLAVARERFGVELPDYRGYECANNSGEIAKLFDARAGAGWHRITPFSEIDGDVVVLRLGAVLPAHAGIVVDRGAMLHTMAGRNACVERYRGRLWQNRVEGFYRWLPR